MIIKYNYVTQIKAFIDKKKIKKKWGGGQNPTSMVDQPPRPQREKAIEINLCWK